MKIHNSTMLLPPPENKENIKVIIRIRPRIEREYDQSCTCIKVDGNSIITTIKNETKQFTYDYIATEESSQMEIFEQCARGICDSTLQGYNGTIFVYGQTGAGKTYTLLGPKYSCSNLFLSRDSSMSESPMNMMSSVAKGYLSFSQRREEEGRGVLPRVIDYLFEKSRQLENSTVSFACSFLEIYQEQISDLLDVNTNKQISIRDLTDGVIAEGLSKLTITTAEEALELMYNGSKLRHIAPTGMNKESSRSHAVFSIYIETKSKSTGGKLITKKSVFHLIDLAGSERQKYSETTGDRTKEAGKINKSLMQLGHVIKSLIEIAEGKQRHIHYRDSKLTHLLKDSLGGNSKTCIIANISPANSSIHETMSTLCFAQSAKLIKNKAVVNEELSNDLLYRDEIKKLRDKYNSIKAENLYLMSIIEKNKSDKVSGKSTDFCRTLDCVEEEIETMVNEIAAKEEEVKALQSDNDFLKEKIQKWELDLKIKEKELRDYKEISRSISQEHDMIKTQLREYVLKDAYMSQKIIQLENLLQSKEFMLSKEIETLKLTIEENKRLVESREMIISSLNTEIKNYMQMINQRDHIISELKLEIEAKERELEEFQQDRLLQSTREEDLRNEIENYKTLAHSKEIDLKTQEEKFHEFKKKGKTLVDQYDGKIETLKLRQNTLEDNIKRSRMENKNLNILVNELKIERDHSEEKLFRCLDDMKRVQLELDSYKEEKIKLLEENQKLKTENDKLREENDLLSDNKNVNNNKVSLLTKTKQENNKLKEELNEIRKNYDNLQKHIRNVNSVPIALGGKPTILDVAALLTSKEKEINECKKCLHDAILRVKSILENNDEFSFSLNASMKAYIEGKSLEEKFNYYFEKLLKYQEYRDKKELSMKTELEAKESKITSLNRELFLRNNLSDDEDKENPSKKKKRNNTFVNSSTIINSVLNSEISKSIFKTNNKRKFGEMQTSSKENCKAESVMMSVDKPIFSENGNNKQQNGGIFLSSFQN